MSDRPREYSRGKVEYVILNGLALPALPSEGGSTPEGRTKPLLSSLQNCTMGDVEVTPRNAGGIK